MAATPPRRGIRPPAARPEESRTAIRAFLIADLRGYTAFTKKHGDEAAARLAARFAEIAQEGVEAFGGDLIETRGDEVLVTFPSVRRALRAALELQDAFGHETASDPALPLHVRIGVAVGEAVPVGDGFRGGALNLAARLCANAAAGEVLASEELVRLAGTVEGIDFEQLPPLELKGLAEPAHALKVRNSEPQPMPAAAREPVSAGRPDFPPELDPASPLIDRERELRRLRWWWRRARHGRGRAVFIRGPTGIGKSRVAAELARAVHATGASVLYARCAGPAQGVLNVLRTTAETDDAVLCVADDVDAAGGTVLDAIGALVSSAAGETVLVVCTYQDAGSPLVADLIERGDPSGEATLELSPLSSDGVREIARLYAGRAHARLPFAEILEETGGVPGLVHRAAGEWAREQATGRVSTFASRTATGRSRLRATETGLADSVIDFQHARERRDLYAEEPVAPIVCPFKGLATFDTDDSDYFFGREQLVAEMVARLVGASFLGVVGPSGSGKSSAVRAGLVPALAAGVIPGSERWTTSLIRPGEHPLSALPATAPHGFVVVDQFEEVFTSCHDEGERAQFIRALTDSDAYPTVVVALRADFYGRCAAYPEFGALLAANQVLVGPMQEEELRRAIEFPGRRAGLRVEPELIDALVADVADEPGGLPLLSSALLELWQRRVGRTLTLAAYRETGGVKGAVARLAEDAYGRLSSEQQVLGRAILLRLAGPGEGEAAVRRRAPIAEFDVERNEQAARVLAVLTESRLLTTSEDGVEVAHEALLREWPRLRSWLEEDAEGRRLHLHLMQQANEWDQGGHDDADLYRGARLGAALDWTAGHTLELNERERAFLDASRAAHERANRRLRIGLAVVALLLVLALIAGALFLVQRGRARHEASRATAQEVIAAARASLGIDPERSILLGIEAVEATRSDHPGLSRDAEAVLHDALATSRVTLTVRGAGRRVAFAPDGSRFVSTDPDHAVVVWNASTGQRLLSLATGPVDVYSAKFSPDGRRIVTAASDGTATIWDSQKGTFLRRLTANNAPVVSAEFSPDGDRVLTVGDDGNARVWDARTGAQLGQLRAWKRARPEESPSVFNFTSEWAAFGPGNRVIAGNVLVASKDDSDSVFARVWDVDSDDVVGVLENPDLFELTAMDVSPDGRFIAIGEEGGHVSLVRLPDGRLLDQVHVSGNFVYDVEFNSDGTRLAATSSNATAFIWEITPFGLQQVFNLTGHAREVMSVAFTADGSRLLTGSRDGTARIWDVSAFGGSELLALPGPEYPIRGAVEFTPDGSRLVATSGPEGTVRVWEVATGRQVLLLDQHARQRSAARHVFGVDVSPDGSRIATASRDGTARTFDARTGEEIFRAQPECRGGGFCWLLDVEFSSDGKRIATVGTDVEPRIFDVASGSELRVFHGHETFVFTVKFNRANTRLLTAGSFDATAKIWDPKTGRVIRTLVHEPNVNSAAYSPDGSRIATVGDRGTLRIWDSYTGERLLEVPTAFGQLFPVAFSPDGRHVATAGGDTITLRDATSGVEVLRLKGRALDLTFSPGGDLLAWSSPPPNPSVRVVALDVDRLLNVAHRRVTRSLTPEECRQYLHRATCPARD